MEKKLSSKALEANLAETRAKAIVIPSEHQQFVDLSASHWGINQRTHEFMLEYHHPYSNRRFVVERWREIVLKDFWYYDSLEDPHEAFSILIDISLNLFESGAGDELKGTIIQTLLEFAGKLSEKTLTRNRTVAEILDALKSCSAHDELNVIRNSRSFKMHLKQVSQSPDFSKDVIDITKTVLAKTIDYWAVTSKAEKWFQNKKELFGREYKEEIASIGKPYFAHLRNAARMAESWTDLEAIPSFDDIANHFHQAVDKFDSTLERMYFAVYLLNLPGMHYLKDSLLLDINRLLNNVHKELDAEQIISFSENLFTLFQELKFEYTSTVLDCLMTLGKEVIDSDDQEIIDAYVNSLIQFGFVTPGDVYVDSQWQVKSNVDHVKNVRVWMELIEHAPSKMVNLLAALIVNLRLEGVFISDTDLFQKDITKLLNSEIPPVYKQIKELARIFPAYYNEIGAEGELRDVTTAIDELSFRKDRLIHFLRKQTHTESNSTHLELARRIIQFWYEGSVEPLMKLLPEDVLSSIDIEGEWFIPVHGIIRELCLLMGCQPVALVDVDFNELERLLGTLSEYEDRDKDRVRLLIKIYALLEEKYSFETDNIILILKRSRFFKEDDINRLFDGLQAGDKEWTLKYIYSLMGELKKVILNPEYSEGEETIYQKRHVAAGIPSMYGQYREPKFEALGLSFRLEKLASRLIEQIIDDINLDYITVTTLRRISGVLALFQEGLELDGIVQRRFNSNLSMLDSSFTSASCSLQQYANMFEFLERNVKEIIEMYFLNFYDQPLKMIAPQYMKGADYFSEVEMRQTLHRRFEEFYRGILSSTFLIQTLDNFVADTLNALRSTADLFSQNAYGVVMTYDPELIITSLSEWTPKLDNQIFLGAKAFFLKAMYAAGFPVPDGFVLTTEVFRHRQAITKHPSINEEFERFIRERIAKLEVSAGCGFGDPQNPLLLSVRSGTAMSMPGAMSTLLNVGMNEQIAEGLSYKAGMGRTAWDCYRRFLQSWGMTYGIDRDEFDRVNAHFESKYQMNNSVYFTKDQMREVALEYKRIIQKSKFPVEDDPFLQLKQAIVAVMDSWYSERAKVFRENMQIAEEWGTAVIVQKMVMGNISEKSGTGVLLTHDPEEVGRGISPYGDFRLCSQGEDVVTGWLNILPLTEYQREKYQYDMEISLESAFPDIYRRLIDISNKLVDEYGLGPQEIEFTFESEKPEDLYILQARRQDVQKKDKRFVFKDLHEQMDLVGRGIGIGGGALSGILAFDMKDLICFSEESPNTNRILVRPDTVPDDISMIFKCDGLLTGKGGATSHAAVTAVRLGKVCVVGCKDLIVNEAKKTCTINGVEFSAGDKISLEGTLGNIYKGDYQTEYVDII